MKCTVANNKCGYLHLERRVSTFSSNVYETVFLENFISSHSENQPAQANVLAKLLGNKANCDKGMH
jgi:hypothetical protein